MSSSQGTRRFVEEGTVSSSSGDKVHFLPFKVEYEGEARVGGLFTNQATPHPDLPTVQSNYFRGRPLMGTELELPPDWVAFLGEEESTLGRRSGGGAKIREEEDAPRDVIKVGRIGGSLTYWEWDKPPSGMDGIVKLQDWLALSSVIHEPIEIIMSSDAK